MLVKTIVHRLGINDLGLSSLSQISSFLYPIETSACELHLVYFAKFFVAETQVTCSSKIFENDLKQVRTTVAWA